MKSFKQYILEQTEIRRLKPKWVLREKNPQSQYGGKEKVDKYMLRRIEAWHNPPTEMDSSKFNSWAKDLGFEGIEKVGREYGVHFIDREGNKQVASKFQLPARNTEFIDALRRGEIKSDSPAMRTQISNHYTNNSRKDLVPWIVSELQNAAVFHGHVPSNVHRYGMSPDELKTEKEQSQKIMSTWSDVLNGKGQEYTDKFYDLANEPATNIRHAASLWTSINLLHKNLQKTYHPLSFRFDASRKITPFHYMLAPFAAVRKAHIRFTNHYNRIIESAKAVGIEVPEKLKAYKEIADENLSHAETHSGSERDINAGIHHMMKSGSMEIPKHIKDQRAIEYLSNMRTRMMQ